MRKKLTERTPSLLLLFLLLIIVKGGWWRAHVLHFVIGRSMETENYPF